MAPQPRSTWSALSLLLCSEWTMAGPFDDETLRLRGIDPSLAAYLGQTAGFTEGVHAVRLWVNGQPRGIVNARFDGAGALCIDQSVRDAGELVGTAQSCADFIQQFPETLIEPLPQTGEIKLLVPASALRIAAADLSAFTRGGIAGLLNYDVQGLYNEFDGQRSRFLSANTEAGVNAGDWVLRSRQFYSSVQGRASWQHLEAHAQRTFSDQQALLQLGQINLSNAVMAGARVTGVQWMSEPALGNGTGGGLVQGIAATQARVDVRQGGVLIYSTVVPAGPFELGNIAQLDRHRDVEVTVIEAGGERRTFTVLAATLGLDLPARGFALGVGQLRDSGPGVEQPWVLSASASYPLAPSTSVSGGTLIAQGYNAGGAGMNLDPWDGARLQSLFQAAQTSEPGSTGWQSSLSLNQQLGPHWSTLLSASRQSHGYRELIDSTWRQGTDRRSRLRDQYALGLSWSHPWLGSLGGTWSSSTDFNGERSSRAQLSWGRRLGTVSLTATGQWQTAGSGGLGNALYLSASLPLGDAMNWRSTARQDSRGMRLGTGVQGRLTEHTQYRIAVERASRDGELTYNGGISPLTRAAQLDFGYAGYGRGNQGYSAAARGAVMLHDQGFTLSPYPLQDTFGLLTLGDVAGVQIDTPGGTVWTDRQGQAVLPQLAPFGRSNVQVATASLPRNVDVQQGTAMIQAARGAVPRIAFPVTVTRRVLLQVRDTSGQRLQRGAGVTDEQGQLVTLVQEDGAVFVPNVYASPRLWSRTQDGQVCELHFELAARADAQAYFETATAQCRAH
jgi:outer membrane usher protein FimD/PapC